MKSIIWVFNSAGARFTGGVFSSKEKAEEWIKEYSLSGILTAYPLDKSVYSWATENEHFKPTKDRHNEAGFIGGFTSAAQEHYHYEDGIID